MTALKPLLVDKNAALAITGGVRECSDGCLNETGSYYKFVSKYRFKLLLCNHHSYHIQCIITRLLIDTNWCLTECPIHDAPQCKATGRNDYGPAYFWAPEDYEDFAKAFFRNQNLVDAFLKPEFR